MRPQHITAENVVVAVQQGFGAGLGASMRPQHITAENATGAEFEQATMLLQ